MNAISAATDQGQEEVGVVVTPCNDECCQGVETGRVVQVSLPRKETARTYGDGQERCFGVGWYRSREWLSLCRTQKKVFCTICRFAIHKRLVTFSKCGEAAFVESGFNNWRKCPISLDKHQLSRFHKECQQKYMVYLHQTPINAVLHKREAEDQQKRRGCMLEVMRCVQVIVRQGLAIRGHTDEDSNLTQFLTAEYEK